eukprot:MONOS_9068.1-p1 / transcript=MONOS_9068.1 / gene=MONOS_9068 / organism=Monocercomonoides_exilis_PA203 / gene_product=unspecified product / transcript_product=unspecified product / location=Mono_scaffold00362:9067-9907(-) / protein_length=248 / sequence_SO=supercontig / SO=protein_coding / is_pseudo=false
MIIEEEEKEEEKNEKLLVDLCECYLLNRKIYTTERLIHICENCLLKIASKNNKSQEVQKEAEMALLALSCVDGQDKLDKGLFSNEIIEIIKYHQEHHNLTQLAYQSAWHFFVYKFRCRKELGEKLLNELHFHREAITELGELSRCIDRMEKEGAEKTKIEDLQMIQLSWLHNVYLMFYNYRLRNEENIELIRYLVRMCRTMGDYDSDILIWSSKIFNTMLSFRIDSVDVLLKGGAFNLFLEMFPRLKK